MELENRNKATIKMISLYHGKQRLEFASFIRCWAEGNGG